MKAIAEISLSVLLFSAIGIFGYFLVHSASAQSYILDNATNSAYINDSNAYISVSPITLEGSGNITFELISKKFSGNIDMAFGFDSQILKPANAFYWNGNDYINIAGLFNKVSYNYGGMDTWYLLQNYNVVANQSYQLKSYIEFSQFSGSQSGKYWVCAKPSAETLAQANANGHLYCLDPFWVSSSNTTSPSSPTAYNPSANYSFAINWTDAILR